MNIDAARRGLEILTDYARGCPDAQDAAGLSYVEAAQKAVAAALDELALAQPVVAIFRDGKTWDQKGDEMCVHATADDVAAIGRAVSPV